MDEVQDMAYDMEEAKGQEYIHIPKQFDLERLSEIPEGEREVLIKLMTSDSSLFREETRTTLETYGLIIDQREGTINQLLRD